MKKIILSVVTLFAFSFIQGQDMKSGLRAGLNSSDITNSDGGSSKFGVVFGGFLQFQTSEKMTIQPELLYSMQGTKYDEGNLALEYLNIPVMFKYNIVNHLDLQAGPQLGILLSAKNDGNDVATALKSIDLGAGVGLCYNFTDEFSLDLRYNMGFFDIQKELPSGVDGSKNKSIQLTLSYSL